MSDSRASASGTAIQVPFNRPTLTGDEFGYMQQAVEQARLSGNGEFTRRCTDWLEAATGCRAALLTHSGTGALELAALLSGVGLGDEVIMPSFTFVSTASAFALRGAVPVFVDVREDTLNLDVERVREAIGPRTRAIATVDYGGVSSDVAELTDLADEHGLMLVEDAAQALGATYRGAPVGSMAPLAALSFHDTKNVTCGEGGALLVNDEELIERAEILQEKGTNRQQFFRGQVDKYTWVDLGSSFVPSELSAAFLLAQLEASAAVNAQRRDIWRRYHEGLADAEARGTLRRPVVPPDREPNGHLYYILLPPDVDRGAFIERAGAQGVACVFHYVPLDQSPAGSRYGRVGGPLHVTHDVADRLVRLPLWAGMEDAQVDQVIDVVGRAL
ncbi:MAG TPA: dTDP-4-amino-4,6-dideoxygalactose transaminase [Capillimicrobium sp.]|nr:dTDP-4-amino-4,6-dideoxygalactose transaminase [Capillimicrobium sp.]